MTMNTPPTAAEVRHRLEATNNALAAERDRLKAINAELLEALRCCCDALSRQAALPECGITPTGTEALGIAGAAILKATSHDA